MGMLVSYSVSYLSVYVYRIFQCSLGLFYVLPPFLSFGVLPASSEFLVSHNAATVCVRSFFGLFIVVVVVVPVLVLSLPK